MARLAETTDRCFSLDVYRLHIGAVFFVFFQMKATITKGVTVTSVERKTLRRDGGGVAVRESAFSARINTIITPILAHKAVIMTSEVKARHNYGLSSVVCVRPIRELKNKARVSVNCCFGACEYFLVS